MRTTQHDSECAFLQTNVPRNDAPDTRMPVPLTRRHFCGLIAGGAGSVAAQAQPGFPTKAVTVIVPYSAGGASDLGARTFQSELARRLGTAVAIDNVAGAGGALGVQKLLRAPADGHTLLYGSLSECVLVPLINPDAGYTSDDLSAISVVGTAPAALVARADFPPNSMQAMIAYARSHPGKLTCGSPGIGTFQHLVMETIKRHTGTFVLHVPYGGGSQVINGLMAGHLDVGVIALPSAVGLGVQRRIKVLGVTSPERVPALAQVPSLGETPALRGLNLRTWGMFLAQRGVPEPVLQKLNDTIEAIAAQPSMEGYLQSIGATSPGRFTPSQAQAFLLKERETYRDAAHSVKSGHAR